MMIELISKEMGELGGEERGLVESMEVVSLL